MKKFLASRYLLDSIKAEQYPPPTFGVVAVSVAQFAQIASVVLILAGDKLFSFIGVPTPAWFATINDNKMMTFAGIWFANNIAAQLVATGAFEIYLDDALIFSKLDTGRLPTTADIVTHFKDFGLKEIKQQEVQEPALPTSQQFDQEEF